MISILRDWLHSANIEWAHNQKLEDVFSNGYLIGQLLCNLQIGGLNQALFETQFINDVSIETMTQNYKLIATYLCEGGVNVKPKLLQDIANNVSGAIHRFIYDLKCFMDTTQRETLSQIADPMNAQKTHSLNMGTSSFKSPPRITSPTRIRKYAYEDMQKRDIELKIRKLATEKFHQRSELKWQKYRDHRTEIENNAKYEREFETQLKNERMAQTHDTLVQTLKVNQTHKAELDKFSKQKWAKNQRIKKQRISEKKHFENTQSFKKINTQNLLQKNASTQMIQCLDEFEDILSKTQKLQKNTEREIEASEIQKSEFETEKSEINYEDKECKQSYENPLEHLQKLRQKLPKQTVSMELTQKYLEKIKINVSKQKNEALKREQRRKKLISDEIELNQSKERLDREQEMEAIINSSHSAESQTMKEFEAKIKSIKLHKHIFTQNANLFRQKESEQRNRDEMIRLRRDKQHFEIKKVEFKTKLTIQTRKLQELKAKQMQFEHVQNTKYCRQLTESIVNISYKSVVYRQLSDQKSVPTQLWQEWMDLLNGNNASNNSEHILTNINESKKNEMICDKDLNSVLGKEKQCHSDIIHIQKGLMECMDINGDLNRDLINKTELNNYLKGKGIWTYESSKEEPNNDNLGLIIQEIVSISEGPDPKYAKIIPDVPISIVFMGKPFVGKSTQTQQISDKYALQIIDSEKCIKNALQSFENYNESDESETELSEQQKIGERLKSLLDEGKEVSDELYIDVIFDAILSVKDDTTLNGWILDGFPLRKSQAVLLENKLTGFVEEIVPKKGKVSKKKPSKIAPAPEQDPSDIKKIESGLDFVFYLDIETNEENDEKMEDMHEILVGRAEGRLIDEDSGRVYHITDNPPPNDKCIKERLKESSDTESLPEHFKAWDEKKDELKTWFDKFGIWTAINCNQNRDDITVSIIEMIQQKIETKKQNELEQKQTENDTEIIENDTEIVENESDEITETKDENENENENVSEIIPKEIEETQSEEKEAIIIEMPWDDSHKLKDQSMCQRLHYFWANTEESYIENINGTFELLRHERRRILAYLASTREYFYNFLRRTDGKQSMIDAFQSEYNQIHIDLRREDDTKGELHQRVEDLSFELFEYSMKRKDESVQELDTIKNSVWLRTENNALLNVIMGIIQYELNRYMATIALTKDYFALKNNESIAEDSVEPIDLLEIIQNNQSKLSKKTETDLISEKLQNGIDTALKYIIDKESQNNVFSDIECSVINEENERLKMRLLRLHKILQFYLRDIAERHTHLLSKLDEWIGLRINSENEAIESLVSYVRQTIENESELNYRLVLRGQNFLIDQDIIVCPMPAPIQKKVTNHRFSTKGAFTAKQIKEFIELLRSQNESGIIAYDSFYEILQRLSKNGYAQNEPILPILWNDLSDSAIESLLISSVIIGSECNKYINWKLFVISLIFHTLSVINNTVSLPSLDTLFDLKQAMHAKDVNGTGKLNKHDFSQVSFWFDQTTDNVWQNILFDLFGTNGTDKETVQEIKCSQLLYHLCFNDQSHFGFEKIIALSENLNIINDTTSVSKEHLQSMQMRGIECVEIGNTNLSQIFKDALTINAVRKNNAITQSFDFINIEQILPQSQ